MKTKLREQLKRRKRRMERRIDKKNWSGRSPMIDTTTPEYELSEKTQAISAGGLGAMIGLLDRLDARTIINRSLKVLKVHLPYDEADHVMNIALNLLAGGTCLEHLEDRRCDEAYLNAVGAERTPDPTTAGDFCRRLGVADIMALQAAYNEIRAEVWRQQPSEFFELAIIEADGTMVETGAEKKEGVAMNHKGRWGYHPLVVTLANTRELLYNVNRSGNRPSHEYSADYFDLAIQQCRSAGFRGIRLRGDTDFALTVNFDRWDASNVEFVFGVDARENLVKIADELPPDAWKPLPRRTTASSGPERAKRPNYKQEVVERRGYLDKRLAGEMVAEVAYRPGACSRAYRLIIVRKQIEHHRGQLHLFEDDEIIYRFYITNTDAEEIPTAAVVYEAADRCNQENNISQLKQCCLAAPLDSLLSNWAYMTIASLAWNAKAWAALLIRPSGHEASKEKQRQVKRRLLHMDFTTFRQRILMVPAQIIRTGRRLVYRLLSYRPSVDDLMLMFAAVRVPLRR